MAGKVFQVEFDPSSGGPPSSATVTVRTVVRRPARTMITEVVSTGSSFSVRVESLGLLKLACPPVRCPACWRSSMRPSSPNRCELRCEFGFGRNFCCIRYCRNHGRRHRRRPACRIILRFQHHYCCTAMTTPYRRGGELESVGSRAGK